MPTRCRLERPVEPAELPACAEAAAAAAAAAARASFTRTASPMRSSSGCCKPNTGRYTHPIGDSMINGSQHIDDDVANRWIHSMCTCV